MESFRKEDLGDRDTDWDGEHGYKPIGGLRARHLYDSDVEDANRYQGGRRRHFSRHELLSGNWLYVVDNELPLALSKNTTLWQKSHQQPATTNLCDDCSSFQLLSQSPKVDIQTLTVDMNKLREAAKSCDLCRFFLKCLTRYDIEGNKMVEVFRDCSVLRLSEYSRPFLTILGDPGSQDHFDLMRRWLGVCDQKHRQYGCHSESQSVLPTRVLDVSDGNPDIVRLYCSQRGELDNYVALSHCWGTFTDEQRAKFCTFKENLDDHIKGIKIPKLPKSFKDAIRVTRELGQRYLWIDSLCIIQNDPDDWRREANTMEIVYSMAYFTIAATSAKDSSQGFLNPRQQREFLKIEKASPPPSPPRQDHTRDDHTRPVYNLDWMPRQQYKVYTTTGDGILRELNANLAPPEVEQFPLYICEHIDDFTQDVEQSVLNSRGWVFQERALSRRILHFSATQTYWECGVGVHCETLTLMYNSESNILGDPQFPSSTSQRTDGQNISFFESLFKDYMRRAFTQPIDRAIAFSGLEKRLSKAFHTDVHYGIIGKFFHRNLLWLRPKNTNLTRTFPKSSDSQKQMSPSWSWMSCEGDIDFLSIDFESVAWSEAVKFRSSEELECHVREFKDCKMVGDGDEVIILDSNSEGWSNQKSSDQESDEKSPKDGSSDDHLETRSWVRFDIDNFDIKSLKCVLIGREAPYYETSYGTDCYVIIVKQRGGQDGIFERIGVGLIDSKYISLVEPGTSAILT